jgi:signal transduction histidine kinase
LEESISTVDEVIRDLRNYIFGLRPGILSTHHLDQALRALAESLERESGVAAAVEVEPSAVVAVSEKSAEVLHLATEAISNVRRHAGAQTCRISLRLENGSAVLEVNDDGAGFDPSLVEGEGQGLRNLRERVSQLAGELTVESAGGQGTAVRIAIPV